MRQHLLFFVIGVFIHSSILAQIKYRGEGSVVEAPITISGLQLAGIGYKDLGLKFPGSDTVSNCKITFTRSTIGQMKELKLTLIIRKGIMVQFQINTNDANQVSALADLSTQYYGPPKKSTTTKSVTMSSWETEKNGKIIQTFLILSNNMKKAELVSWVSN
ncbi:MAG TPA: hypothetical protein PK637_00075 [Flavobacteriales bacterium]|nr:hypothetical protein [Flavobacteriales bacterium]HRE95126.1 hypothetical protein [Flavobacteriales bacterium]HRJ36773.1 hypothetical protein [Flavobacteriales bacterium]HRJ39787.1 hypothetical protein [Flavobacteriales bacterium]